MEIAIADNVWDLDRRSLHGAKTVATKLKLPFVFDLGDEERRLYIHEETLDSQLVCGKMSWSSDFHEIAEICVSRPKLTVERLSLFFAKKRISWRKRMALTP